MEFITCVLEQSLWLNIHLTRNLLVWPIHPW